MRGWCIILLGLTACDAGPRVPLADLPPGAGMPDGTPSVVRLDAESGEGVDAALGPDAESPLVTAKAACPEPRVAWLAERRWQVDDSEAYEPLLISSGTRLYMFWRTRAPAETHSSFRAAWFQGGRWHGLQTFPPPGILYDARASIGADGVDLAWTEAGAPHFGRFDFDLRPLETPVALDPEATYEGVGGALWMGRDEQGAALVVWSREGPFETRTRLARRVVDGEPAAAQSLGEGRARPPVVVPDSSGWWAFLQREGTWHLVQLDFFGAETGAGMGFERLRPGAAVRADDDIIVAGIPPEGAVSVVRLEPATGVIRWQERLESMGGASLHIVPRGDGWRILGTGVAEPGVFVVSSAALGPAGVESPTEEVLRFSYEDYSSMHAVAHEGRVYLAVADPSGGALCVYSGAP